MCVVGGGLGRNGTLVFSDTNRAAMCGPGTSQYTRTTPLHITTDEKGMF